jgi:hypothetical protein
VQITKGVRGNHDVCGRGSQKNGQPETDGNCSSGQWYVSMSCQIRYAFPPCPFFAKFGIRASSLWFPPRQWRRSNVLHSVSGNPRTLLFKPHAANQVCPIRVLKSPPSTSRPLFPSPCLPSFLLSCRYPLLPRKWASESPALTGITALTARRSKTC